MPIPYPTHPTHLTYPTHATHLTHPVLLDPFLP